MSNVVHVANPVPRIPARELVSVDRLHTFPNIKAVAREVFLALYDEPNERFLSLIDAMYPEQSVNGTIMDDSVLAAEMMLVKAKQMNLEYFAKLPTRTVRRYLNAVMTDLNISRKQRKEQAPSK